MKWMVYNLLFFVGYLLMLPKFVWRMWKRGGYRKDFLQRLALYRPDVRERIRQRRRYWIHAVSVGEVGVALRFIEEIRRERPEAGFILTTTTSTGHRIASGRLSPADVLLYFPSDFPLVIRRALRALDPLALILTEGEIWPNLIRQADARGVPVFLINGRVSGRSFAGYRKVRAFIRPVLERMRLLLVQGEKDRERLEALGAPPDRLRVMGSAKFDVARADAAAEGKARTVLAQVGFGAGDPILVGGSTWPGEEAALCGIYPRLRAGCAGLRLVLVPRHAERRAQVEADIRRSGLTWKRRSELPAAGVGNAGSAADKGAPDVLLVDSTGELMGFYACASVIFVGKSLCESGGQNPIEPAMLGKAVVVGPNMENFEPVMADFLSAGAVRQVQDMGGLESALGDLLANAGAREALGAQARCTVESRRGCVRESVRLVLDCLACGHPGSGASGTASDAGFVKTGRY